MNLVIFSPLLKATTGSPIRAVNIVKGLAKFGGSNHIVLVSSAFDERFLSAFKCYSIGEAGIQKTLERAVEENAADSLLCITHGFVDIVSEVAKTFDVPLFVDMHGIATLEILEERIGLSAKYRKIRPCLPWLTGLLRAKRIFCANPMLYAWMKLLFRKKAVELCGLTDVASFKSADREDRFVNVLYAGNLRDYQGVGLLLDAIGIIGADNDFRFHILGSGQMDERMGRKVDALGKSANFVLKPTIEYDEYPAFLNSMDVFVIPRPSSLTAYMAFPQKIVEAMSAGKCVVATDLSPHRYALRNPTCGILCQPNPRSIAKAIKKTGDRHLRKSLGEAARAKAFNAFDLPVQISKMVYHMHAALR